MTVPRVTEILSAYTTYNKVHPDILERAAARGSTVHSLCAGIAKGNWIPDGIISEEYLGYVNSFKMWAKNQVDKFIIIEKRYVDEISDYTGQLDYVIRGHDKELYLVDLKTSARPQKTYPVQMAAYDRLLRANNINVKGAILVYLDKDGEFPDIDYLEDLTEETHIFLSALECWHYFNKRKKDDKSTRATEESGNHTGADDADAELIPENHHDNERA